MAKFRITAKVTGADGSTRTVTGTVNHPSPDKGRVRADAGTQLRKTLADGETFNTDDIDVRHSR